MSYLLIDGHSVLFQWKDMSVLHRQRPAQAREALTRVLSHLHDTSDWRITLVFDGQSGPTRKAEPGKIHVIYSSRDQTADSVIERLVHSAPDPSAVSVVTADRQEQLTVESFGALVYHPDWLKDECERNDSEWKETLRSAEKQARW